VSVNLDHYCMQQRWGPGCRHAANSVNYYMFVWNDELYAVHDHEDDYDCDLYSIWYRKDANVNGFLEELKASIYDTENTQPPSHLSFVACTHT